MTFRRELQAAAIALLASLAIGSVLILVVGKAPGTVWWAMLSQISTDWYELGQVLYKATSFALVGLSVALALDVGLFNIGAEGQLAAGVLACAVAGTALPVGTPALIAIPVCLAAAAAGGALVGAAIGAMRAYRGAHEVITSIMFNKIVAGVALWIGNAWIFENGTTTGGPIAPGAVLPGLGMRGSAANVSLVLAAALVGGLWWLRARSTWGQSWRAVGRDPEAARSVGISIKRIQLWAMTGAGALAGLAAANFVMGHKHAYEAELGAGTGFTGIAVALLGRVHPVGIAVASLLLAFLSQGGLAVGDRVPKELTEILQGVVMVSIAVAVPWVKRRAR